MNCLGCLLLVLCAATSWAQTSTAPKRREADTTLPPTPNIIECLCRWDGLSSSGNRIGGRAQFPPKAQSA